MITVPSHGGYKAESTAVSVCSPWPRLAAYIVSQWLHDIHNFWRCGSNWVVSHPDKHAATRCSRDLHGRNGSHIKCVYAAAESTD